MYRRSKAVVWNGVPYSSISAAARANNVNFATMWQRLNKGYSSDEEVAAARAANCVPVVWNGVRYESIAEAARDNGISYRGMVYRLQHKYEKDRDVHVGRRNRGRRIPVVWNGIEYPSLSEAARENGISVTAMKYRLSCGYTCDKDVRGRRRSLSEENYTDFDLEMLWQEMGDSAVLVEDEILLEGWRHFPAGTHIEDVWRWFDERYSGGVYGLMFSKG